MSEYLAQEKPRLVSAQAPGQPAKRFDKPKPAPKRPHVPQAPPPVERIVHVGPSFWTIVRAVIVGQLLLGFLGFVYFEAFVRPDIERDLRCAALNIDRVIAGQPEQIC